MPSDNRFPDATVTAHVVHRLDFQFEEGFESFRARYENAVPEFTPDIVGADDGWDAITERTAAAAPHGFLRYQRLDTLPFFSRAGHNTQCTTYLMGNHVFAERMFGSDPAVMLYAPLRVAIHAQPGEPTHFVIDQPSTRFASFGQPGIAEVGEFLDEKLDLLMSHLLVDTPVAAR